MDVLIKELSADFSGFLKDESRTVGYAETISFPKDEEQTRAILAELAKSRTPVTIQGSRTGLAAGAVPFGGHVMNMSRMNRVLGLRRGEGCFFLSVQPGVILSQLKKDIEEKRFTAAGWSEESVTAAREFADSPEHFFPSDPTESSACIGGITACNASGARSYLYKSVRTHISALRLALWDGGMLALKRGETFASGRELELRKEDGSKIYVRLPSYEMPQAKNASGYYARGGMDAIDLIIGSDGTLGVLTEIELRLIPLPAVIWGVSCFFKTEADAVNFVEQARRDSTDVAAIEYFDSGAISILREQKKSSAAFAQLPDVAEDVSCCVYTELHCADEETALAGLFRIGDLAGASGGDERKTWAARNARDLESLQFFRHAVPESVNMFIDERRKTEPAITKLGADMSVPRRYLSEVVSLYRSGLEKYGLDSAVWGHIGDNHLHVNILPRDGEDFKKGKELFSEWARAISAMGGSVSAEHGVGKIKSAFLEVMYGRAHITEMAEMKRAFDPYFIFGRGNLFPADILTEEAAR